MTTCKRIRSIAGVLAAPALSGVIGLSVVIGGGAPARSEPTTDCSVMAHPTVSADPGSNNPLTRPGQLGQLTQVPAPNADMPMDCPPIGHG